MSGRFALIDGRDRPFGAEISAALESRGFTLDDKGAARRIDVLAVNRPVTLTAQRFDEVSDAVFDAAMDDILLSTVGTVRELLPRLAPQARIVLIGSRGHLGASGGAHLMAASAALAGAMRCMALEFAGRGVSVNLVAAGFVGGSWDTPAARREVAETVCMLAEPGTGLVGETLIVDGGRSLRMSESRRR